MYKRRVIHHRTVPQSFFRTLRAVEAERKRGWISLAVGVTLALAWVVWALTARITLYASTTFARVEATRSSHPIAPQVDGRVVHVRMPIGSVVATGDILVELDSEPQTLLLAEVQARLDGLGPVMTALEREIAKNEEALVLERESHRGALDESGALVRDAEAARRLAEDESGRLDRLFAGGLASPRDVGAGRNDAERRAAMLDALKSKRSAIEYELRGRESERMGTIEGLRGRIRAYQRDAANDAASIKRLENEIEMRRVRAPIAGRIGEALDIRPGAFLEAGARVGSIVPDGPLRVVAQFDPADALGRVQTGQYAQLRLQGFPSTEYGVAEARVTAVAEDLRDGRIRVELTIESPPPTLPLQHGLPGDVVIEVERVRPIDLLLRTVGRAWTTPTGLRGAPSASNRPS